MSNRTLFIAGNWKMNKTATEAEKIITELKTKVSEFSGKVNIAVCPAFTALDRAVKAACCTNIKIGAQDISEKASGAYTGEISAEMLLDLGVEYVIVGHSERRQYHAETDDEVSRKAKFALKSGLLPIICIGETLEEREADKTSQVITSQIRGSLAGLSSDEILKTTLAYEPVWAIGTGKTASPEQAQEVHKLIRSLLTELYSSDVAEKVIIQYGGSVKAGNSAELMSQKDIDGALVGGASLDAEDFRQLIANAL
ncbi:MAG TPA: triose-phosphate isomerase [Victivallales bacterium]|nr:triose-phosphate isomerase [Victivallales bacterium]